ncbi:hypothetical protein HZA43_04995 [Candidatus Peregrinibacteria bacterium]|nr:hypothetical protein [Candidatus Peregrinibacteria bacterium]
MTKSFRVFTVEAYATHKKIQVVLTVALGLAVLAILIILAIFRGGVPGQ